MRPAGDEGQRQAVGSKMPKLGSFPRPSRKGHQAQASAHRLVPIRIANLARCRREDAAESEPQYMEQQERSLEAMEHEHFKEPQQTMGW
jgi:hypothetical protein